MTARKFKERYIQHSFNENRRKCPTLLDFIWLNQLNLEPAAKWSMIKPYQTYVPGTTASYICTSEKSEILKHINNPQ